MKKKSKKKINVPRLITIIASLVMAFCTAMSLSYNGDRFLPFINNAIVIPPYPQFSLGRLRANERNRYIELQRKGGISEFLPKVISNEQLSAKEKAEYMELRSTGLPSQTEIGMLNKERDFKTRLKGIIYFMIGLNAGFWMVWGIYFVVKAARSGLKVKIYKE